MLIDADRRVRGGGALRVAVVGAGWIARRVHLPYLADHGELELACIVEPDAARRAAVERTYRVPVAPSLDALPNVGLDAAVICAPPACHAELIVESLERGLHVISEKPFVTSEAQARQVIELATRHGLALRCCHTSRFRPDVRALADAIADGELGAVRHLRMSWHRARGVPATGGSRQAGALWDLGAHLVDLVWMLTELPEPIDVCAAPVWASAADANAAVADWQDSDESHATDDVLVGGAIQMRFPYATATIEVHWTTGIASDETEILVHGTHGCALLRSVFGNSPDRAAASSCCLRITKRGGALREVVEHGAAGDEYAAQEAFLFRDLRAGGVWPPPEQLIRAVRVVEHAHEQCAPLVGAGL